MAETFSFDIVSDVDLQEVDNAVNQTRKEIAQRYDFKGSKSTIDLRRGENTLTLVSDDEFRMKALVDILQNKLIKRGVPLKAIAFGPVEPAAGSTVRRVLTLRVGIDRDNARRLVKMIKESGARVQAQIMEDQVRVTGKVKDDLQSIIAMLRSAELDFAIQFRNYR
jgi:uncharacterized protein YajQ (UPF0234 family)